jgi:osmotically-inducible protein OsmY
MNENSAARIAQSLTAALEREPRFNLHRFPIHVSLADGAISLEGTVEDIVAKRVAMTIAHRVANNVPVRDRLRVEAGPRSHEDGTLRDHVTNAVLGEPVFSRYRIRVQRNGDYETLRQQQDEDTGDIAIVVRDAVVTLEGHVGSLTHRRLAEVLAWWSSGCEDVDNRLRVAPPEQENDGELSDAIRIVMEKDPLVHADRLAVNVRGKTVTLSGYAASKEEHRLAVLDTWYVPGVHEVIDRIQTI